MSWVKRWWDEQCLESGFPVSCALFRAGLKGITFGNLLSFVNLGNLLLEELVTLLAELQDLGSFNAPSYSEEKRAVRLLSQSPSKHP